MIDELGHAAPFDDRYPATNERCAEVSAVTRSRAVGGSACGTSRVLGYRAAGRAMIRRTAPIRSG